MSVDSLVARGDMEGDARQQRGIGYVTLQAAVSAVSAQIRAVADADGEGALQGGRLPDHVADGQHHIVLLTGPRQFRDRIKIQQISLRTPQLYHDQLTVRSHAGKFQLLDLPAGSHRCEKCTVPVFIPGQFPGIFRQRPVNLLPIPFPAKAITFRSPTCLIALVPVRRHPGAAVLIAKQRTVRIHTGINDADEDAPSPLPQLRGAAHLHDAGLLQFPGSHQAVYPGHLIIINVRPLPGKRSRLPDIDDGLIVSQ